MVTTAAGVEWTVVSTEVEALQLEYAWIKEFDPRFNVKYRDDKSYPYLAVTMGEEFPRVQVMRGAKRKGTRYFGPYAHAWAIRETVDLLLRVFPVRTCSNGVFKRAGQVGPALPARLHRQVLGAVRRPDRRRGAPRARRGLLRLHGRADPAVRPAPRAADERAAASELDYERAARLRDDLAALNRALEKSAVVLPDGTDADVFALAEDDLEAAVQVFHVRDGRVRGQRGWVVEKVEDVTTADLVEQLLLQVYGDDGGEARAARGPRPRRAAGPRSRSRSCSAELRGSRVAVRVPQRGDKKALAETVARNAGQALALHKTRRAGDLTTRSKALAEIQERARPGRGAAADRVLRRVEHPGRPRRRVDGRLRGRAAAQERVPPLHDPGRRRPGRRRGDPRGRSPGGSGATSRTRRAPASTSATAAAQTRGRMRTPPTTARAAPGPRSTPTPAAPALRLPAAPRRRRRRPAAGRRGRARAGRARASTTSRCAGWPSGSRRSGCPATSSRSSCRGPARASTCCSGSATRRTASRSPTTGSGAARR